MAINLCRWQHKPFKGGYITRHYGNNPIPWIQIEMNRKLYLSKEYFDYGTLQMKGNQLDILNNKFRETINLFYTKSKESFLKKGGLKK